MLSRMLEEGYLRLYVTAGYVLIMPAIFPLCLYQGGCHFLGNTLSGVRKLDHDKTVEYRGLSKKSDDNFRDFWESLTYRSALSSPFVDVQKLAIIIQRKCCPRSTISCFPSCVVTKHCFAIWIIKNSLLILVQIECSVSNENSHLFKETYHLFRFNTLVQL